MREVGRFIIFGEGGCSIVVVVVLGEEVDVVASVDR